MFTLAKLALIAAVVGAVNWLLVGLFQYNFIADIFGSGSQPVTSMGERVIYIVFGAGGIIALLLLAAGTRRVVTARTDEVVERRGLGDYYSEFRDYQAFKAEKAQRDDEVVEERGVGDYSEFRDYQAFKAEKARHAERPRPESDQASAEAAQQTKQDE